MHKSGSKEKDILVRDVYDKNFERVKRYFKRTYYYCWHFPKFRISSRTLYSSAKTFLYLIVTYGGKIIGHTTAYGKFTHYEVTLLYPSRFSKDSSKESSKDILINMCIFKKKIAMHWDITLFNNNASNADNSNFMVFDSIESAVDHIVNTFGIQSTKLSYLENVPCDIVAQNCSFNARSGGFSTYESLIIYEKYIKSEKYHFLKLRITDYKEQCIMCVNLLRRLESLLDRCYIRTHETSSTAVTMRHIITFEEKDYYQGSIHIFNKLNNRNYMTMCSLYNVCYYGYYFLNGLANVIEDDLSEGYYLGDMLSPR